MGYEIKMIVGKTGLAMPEWKRSNRRYEDDSGYEPERDDKGNIVYTGRNEHWFQVMAMIDLCKLGYQDDPLNRIIAQSHKHAKDTTKTDVWFYYADDGNTHINEDHYGAAMSPVPVKDVLAAMKQSADATKYRRLIWAIALLESMSTDPEDLEVMFFGH